MAAADARTAIGTLLTTEWVDGLGAQKTPIAWPNRDFTPPKTGPWVRVSINEGDSFQVTIGTASNVHRHTGVLFLSVFVPQNTGDNVARQLADQLAAIFRGLSIDGGSSSEVLRFRTPRVRAIGTVDGVYYQVNCEVPFIRDALF